MKMLIFTCLVLLFSGCQEKVETLDTDVPQSLEEIFEIASESDNIKSLIISRGDEILAEKYYTPYSGDSLDHLRSATKSIMSTLIGIAVDKGFIQSIEDPIYEYIKIVPREKEGIKIKHLLNMTSGLKWNEGLGYNDNNYMVDSGNPLEFLMDLPMVNTPGTHWEYSTGDIHLLSAVLTEATGMTTRDFAVTYLFEPLDIQDFEWQQLGDGYFSGGSRLQLKPRDMWKIGKMYTNNGVYGGQRIVSSEYLQSATDVQYVFNSNEEEQVKEGYGYGFWTINTQGTKAFMASGYAGQTIANIPELGLVIVMTHKWRVGGEQAMKQQQSAQQVIGAVLMWARAN